MPRPSRKGAQPISLTLSEEVAKALRVRAAIAGVDIGRLADDILRKTLEPWFPQVEALAGELVIQPVETPAVLHPMPASTSHMEAAMPLPQIASPGSPQRILAKRTAASKFDNPKTRKEYERSFLLEALEQVQDARGWEDFAEALITDDAFARKAGHPLMTESTIEEELKSWNRKGHIPSQWKGYVLQAVNDITEWEPSIFGSGLGPDEFFGWEQPR